MWGAEELCQLGQAGFWWLIELLVLVGEYVETCGHLIYACRQLKGSDLDLLRVWVGVWAGRLGGWAQAMFQFLSQGFCYGAGLFTRFLRLVGALLLLALALLLGCLQLGWRFLVGLSDRLGWRGKATWLFSWLASPTWQRCLILLRESRPWQQLVRIVQLGWLELPWVKQRTNRQGNAPVAGARYCQPEEEVARLLTMAGVPEDELNPFHVLGVEATASDVELKKAYRQLAVMVSTLPSFQFFVPIFYFPLQFLGGVEEGTEMAMATHSSTLAWKIPWMEESGRLQSMGSLRVRHD